jgi:hypothetical protein
MKAEIQELESNIEITRIRDWCRASVTLIKVTSLEPT